MSTNVVSLFGEQKKVAPRRVPQDFSGPILAITDWAESHGIDVEGDLRFHYRLADFIALMQVAIVEKSAAA